MKKSPSHSEYFNRSLLLITLVTFVLPVLFFATNFRAKAQQPVTKRHPVTDALYEPAPALKAESVAKENRTAVARAAAPSDTQQTIELKIDDGSGEVIFRADGVMIVNRLTPTSYPAKLTTLRIAFAQLQGQPTPVGQSITLLIYVDASGAGQLPANPMFTRIPATINTADGNFVDFSVTDGPTLTAGDLYVGYQSPSPNNGVGFLADVNSTHQNRTFFSTNNGTSFTALTPPTGATSANVMVRALVTGSASGPAPTVSAIAPTSAAAYSKNVTLTVTGTNFDNSSLVLFNGLPTPTTFVSATQLQAQLRADDLAAAGSATVVVRRADTSESSATSFTISAATLAQAEVEPNDTPTTADILQVPGTRTGAAAEADAAPTSVSVGTFTLPLHDIYAFRLTQPTNVEFILQWTNTSADLDLAIIRDNGGSLSVISLSAFDTNQQGAVIPAERTVRTLAAGRYLVAVSAFDGASPYTLSTTIPTLGVLNAASYNSLYHAAPDAIVAAFGGNLATSTQAAATFPLPTQLAGTSVKVKDSAGVERLAPLFFVSAGQVNFLIPPESATGLADVTVTSGSGVTATDRIIIRRLVPGLFTANASGIGVPAALTLRVKADNSQVYETLSRLDATTNQYVPTPIDLGPTGEQVFLVLYGTGIRGRGNLNTLMIFGTDDTMGTAVAYAGPVSDFAGLDQVNVLIPRRLIGRGNLDIALVIDPSSAGPVSNTVTINIR